MGDRANFGVRQGDDVVFLYGHWAGYGMMATLANGLNAVRDFNRLNDETYATRILFSQIVGESWIGSLGWGISVNSIVDNEHKIPVVDFREGTVTLYDWKGDFDNPTSSPLFTTTIDNFIRRYAKPLASV